MLIVDLVAGASVLRQQIERGVPAREIARGWQPDLDAFMATRPNFLMY